MLKAAPPDIIQTKVFHQQHRKSPCSWANRRPRITTGDALPPLFPDFFTNLRNFNLRAWPRIGLIRTAIIYSLASAMYGRLPRLYHYIFRTTNEFVGHRFVAAKLLPSNQCLVRHPLCFCLDVVIILTHAVLVNIKSVRQIMICVCNSDHNYAKWHRMLQVDGRRK